MGGEDDDSVLLELLNEIPDVPTRHGVHAGGGLCQAKDVDKDVDDDVSKFKFKF